MAEEQEGSRKNLVAQEDAAKKQENESKNNDAEKNDTEKKQLENIMKNGDNQFVNEIDNNKTSNKTLNTKMGNMIGKMIGNEQTSNMQNNIQNTLIDGEQLADLVKNTNELMHGKIERNYENATHAATHDKPSNMYNNQINPQSNAYNEHDLHKNYISKKQGGDYKINTNEPRKMNNFASYAYNNVKRNSIEYGKPENNNNTAVNESHAVIQQNQVHSYNKNVMQQNASNLGFMQYQNQNFMPQNQINGNSDKFMQNQVHDMNRLSKQSNYDINGQNINQTMGQNDNAQNKPQNYMQNNQIPPVHNTNYMQNQNMMQNHAPGHSAALYMQGQNQVYDQNTNYAQSQDKSIAYEQSIIGKNQAQKSPSNAGSYKSNNQPSHMYNYNHMNYAEMPDQQQNNIANNQFQQNNYNPNIRNISNRSYQMPPQNKQQYYNQQRYNQQMYQNYMRQMYNQGYHNQMNYPQNGYNNMQMNRNEIDTKASNESFVNNEMQQPQTNTSVNPIAHDDTKNDATKQQNVNFINNAQENNMNSFENNQFMNNADNFGSAYNQTNMFNLKNLEHEDPYKEYVHESPIPQKITQKKKKTHEEDSTSSSSSSTGDDSESVESTSSGEEEEMPKKRGRPRKTTQQISYQMPQMPYNPYIQPPLGNQYQPNFRPMMYKPVHPFNPNNPRYPGDYRTKHMRNVSGSNASSYNAIFNMQMHKQGYFPPNMYPQQPMMYHPGMYPNNAPLQRSGGQEGSIYGYARTPNVGRPKSAHKREAPTSPLLRKKRKSAIQNMIKKIEVEEDVTEETNEEEQDPIEKLLIKRDDDYFFVKFRHKSYLHCDWVHKDEIGQTKGGLIKTKRFRAKEEPFDPDFLKVEKVYHEDYEDVEVEQGTENSFVLQDGKTYVKKKILLIKWRKTSHELSTFEYEEKVKDLEGFEEAYKRMIERKKCKIRKYSIEWRPLREQFIRFNTSPIFKNDNTLRAYQLEGLNWLLNRWFYKQGCIMADEMGLGKTVQSVTFINTLFTRYECGPVLIVAPLSTLPHWEREFEAWSDLRVTTYHGSLQGREIIYSYEMINRDDRNNYLFDVLITTYEMVMSGQRHLENIKFSVGIFDEAHRLKNNNSKAVLALKNIYFNHKVLLSGTPLQNNLQELWALLNFIDPMRYSSAQYFLEEYKLEKSEDVERLQNLLKPLMLRRMKDDVEKSIPVKEETIIEVELTMIQKKFYRAILEKNLEFLKRGEKAPSLGNIMVELRKCCIHPYLITSAEEKIIKEYKDKQRRYIEEIQEEYIDTKKNDINMEKSIKINDVTSTIEDANVIEGINTDKDVNIDKSTDMENDTKLDKSTDMENDTKLDKSTDMVDKPQNTDNGNFDNADENTDEPLNVSDNIANCSVVAKNNINVSKTTDFNYFGLTREEYYKVLIQSSGKLVLLDKLLNKLKGKHKVLIFSQMTTCLDLLSEYLVYKKYKHERIDGGVRADHRQAAIDRFSIEANDIFVFLLCTRAGGVGINLTAADTVVIFDSDWNPQNDLQAQARCHRIGQKNEVKIYRLVTRNSYEREMFDKAGLKLGLDRAVLQKMSFEGEQKMKKNAAIELLLKKGAYGVLMENDDVNSKFCEEDIDSILERRTKVVKHLESGNIFSKASFQVDEEVDDPHFWENLLSKKKSEADEGKIKRQVRRLSKANRIENEEIDRLIERMERELDDYENVKMYRSETKSKEKSNTTEIQNNDESKVNESKVDESKVDESKVDESKVDESKVDESKVDENKVDESKDADNKTVENKPDNSKDAENKPDNSKETSKIEGPIDQNDNINVSSVTIRTVSSTNDYSSDRRSFEYTEKFSLLVFLTVLKKGTHALQTLKSTKNSHKILSSVVKFCTEKIDNKQRDDYTLHMDHLLKEPFEKEVFMKYASLYDKYYEVFLLRVQIVLILTYLTKKSDIGSVERVKGFTYEDDKRIVNWVITYGYDNFPSSTGREKGAFKGKSSNELNQRLRKIVMGLNKKSEEEEDFNVKEDIERECLLLFGRVCEDNQESIKKWFKGRVSDNREYEDFEKKLNEIVENVTNGKNKRGGSEVGLHKRIILFDNLRRIYDLPIVKKTNGLTRRWNHENDAELRDYVIVNGLKDEIMGIGMDVAIKRLQLLVDSENEDKK